MSAIKIKSLNQMDVTGKRVLLRSDLNVPMRNGVITDDMRIISAIPTIRTLLEKQVDSLVIVAHLGRPSQKDMCYSLEPIAHKLTDMLGQAVILSDKIPCERNEKVVLLENIRFFPGEEINDPVFAKQLSVGADLFVNDAFSVSHRMHASIVGVAKFLPSCAGLLLEKEVLYLTNVLENPLRPLSVIMGGSKISTKLPIIRNIVTCSDYLLIGGGIANTLLWAQGHQIGKSFHEPLLKSAASDILNYNNLVLPIDVAIAPDINSSCVVYKDLSEIEKDDIILDIGPKTVNLYSKYICESNTILWNGPLGLFEVKPFDYGTKSIAKILASHPGTTVVGGGDTFSGVEEYRKDFTCLSTAGGAFLEFIEGRSLPGLDALSIVSPYD